MVGLVEFLLLVATLAEGATTQTKFKWRTSFNRDTGIATSCEESSTLFSNAPLAFGRIAKHSQEIIEEYPKFLTKRSLTFGLLKTRNVSAKQIDLCTSICPLNLLSFGSPTDTSNTIRKRLAHEYSGTVLYSLETPILGGLLSQSSKRECANKCEEGLLRFTLIQKGNTPSNSLNILFVTEIAGSYRPSIAGKLYPRSKIRSAIYCTTQRIFHEYVMWRFHRLFTFELDRHLKSCVSNEIK
jgi:hypothetical protein